MTSKCNSCNNAILNADFISCAGACKEMFHIKCVAVNKSMLNAVNTCPNIHWYCHECNGGNRNISVSIDRVIASIGSLTNSLSSDLIQFVNGFSTLTENLMSAISLPTRSDGQSLTASPKKCSHEGNVRSCNGDLLSTSTSLERSSCESNIESFHCAESIKSNMTYDRKPLRSVVASNIGKDMTLDYLTDYLADELNIDKENLSLSLLIPTGRTIDDLEFLQYKITVPEDKYNSIICSNSWPSNVHIRDFVYKSKRKGVAKQQFLTRKKFCSNLNSTNEDLSSTVNSKNLESEPV